MFGYNKIEFARQTALDKNGEIVKNDMNESLYYYMHNEKACYHCIIHASDTKLDESLLNDIKKSAYYNALAREKYNLVKLSNYVNGSGELKK